VKDSALHCVAGSVAAPVEGAAPRGAPAGRLGVRRLVLTDFRCYARLRLETGVRPVVLTGPNGAGKTNLLEALSFLAPGRGMRRARLDEIDRKGGGIAARWAVAAFLATSRGPLEIGTGRDPDADADSPRRVVRIDGKPMRGQAGLARLVSVLWVTPDMDRLFQEGAGGRRRFLDRMVYGADPDHAGRVAAYDHALRERARLLREGVRDEAWLAALEATMAEKGVAIAAARRALVRRLEDALRLGMARFPRARIALRGTLEGWLDGAPALEVEDRFKTLLADSRGADAETGGGLDGPHRADLAVEHVENGMPASLCSTGEQKALLIALVLAHARLQALEHSALGLLLLDEVAAHLDRARRAALYEELRALGVQAWMTGTDEALFDGMGDNAQYFRVIGGDVVAR
jgi:DNA replication and repair protein RecF